MKYEVVGFTDVGLVRQNNEDSYLINKDLNLFIVADGMGGYEKGEVASFITCESIEKYFQQLVENNQKTISFIHFKEAVQQANTDILKKINDSPGLERMGSTVIALLMRRDKLLVANVGDSRAYVLRGGKLRQISVDHSLIQESKSSGISQDLAKQFKNIVTRAVGMKAVVESDVFSEHAKKGDKFLLCSDGLHGAVGDNKIKDILSNSKGIETQAKMLIEEAKAAGGKDNITCVIIEVHEDSVQNDFTKTVEISTLEEGKRRIFSISVLLLILMIALISLFIRRS